jgi:hypothetical protein
MTSTPNTAKQRLHVGAVTAGKLVQQRVSSILKSAASVIRFSLVNNASSIQQDVWSDSVDGMGLQKTLMTFLFQQNEISGFEKSTKPTLVSDNKALKTG